MFKSYGFGGNCAVLGVLCGKSPDGKEENLLPKLTSSGRLEVHLLRNPSVHQFQHSLKSISPSFLYLRGEQWGSEDRSGSVVLDGVYPSNPETFSSLIGPKLPNMVYLEIPNGRKFADALYAKGIPYVIYWETELPNDGASQFRQALLSVIQSSRNHPWDTFQLAHASFRLYCARDNIGSTIKSQNMNGNLESNGPCLLGNAPKITIPSPENIPGEGDDMSDNLPSIKIYDDDVKIKFLICGPPCPLDARLLGSIEDGLNALLNIEIRGSKLHHRISAVPPPLQAGAFSRGVITMRCDLTTSSSAHISLLVSSSAQTCFDDQLLENHIKKELTESRKLVKAIFHSEENNPFFTDPRMSCSIACGSPVFEVCMKVPTWASQVLKQLAPEVSYRSLVSLGVASIQGSSVASFEKEDAQRLLSFTANQGERLNRKNNPQNPPAWLKCPPPTRKRSMSIQGFIPSPQKMFNQKIHNGFEERRSSVEPPRKRLKTAAMKPIPYAGNHRLLPFPGEHANGVHDGNHVKTMIPTVSFPRNVAPATVSRKKASSNSFREKTASMGPCFNPLPLKKHDCSRCPIGSCSEEDFLKDVMEFLIQRGNHKLVPLGGLQEFPDAILNAKRLDLYNLYREVVTRGGYLVGNGINWKGQVFSKMRNHTATNKMTGVGNTLKRHYETYLAEYELAHDDVDGECCLLCNSSEAGDWVNCGLCGEWAHFGCDKRQGLGAFKDYAKTDGLEYVCPQCSIRNYRKKRSPRIRNGTTHAPISMRTV